MNENARKLAQFRATLEARGDGKCYFPCSDCRGLQRRRILRTTTERHCREKGPTEVWKLNPRDRTITLTKLLIKHAKLTPKETEMEHNTNMY